MRCVVQLRRPCGAAAQAVWCSCAVWCRCTLLNDGGGSGAAEGERRGLPLSPTPPNLSQGLRGAARAVSAAWSGFSLDTAGVLKVIGGVVVRAVQRNELLKRGASAASFSRTGASPAKASTPSRQHEQPSRQHEQPSRRSQPWRGRPSRHHTSPALRKDSCGPRAVVPVGAALRWRCTCLKGWAQGYSWGR